MAKRPGITSPFRATLSPDEMRKAISRFRKLRERFEQFEPDTVVSGDDPKILELASASQIALEKTYPPGTTQNQQYRDLSNFEYSFPQYAGRETPVYQVHEGLKSAKSKAIVLLRQAIEDLEEDLGDASEPAQLPVPTVSSTLERTVFVVHGHDGESREAIARFLEKLQFKPIILHEQPGGGRTIIEKFEDHGTVGFAVVLLTPDDAVTNKDGSVTYRARQNVVLELGYFIGALKRKRVCAIKKGEVEIPSDLHGIQYVSYDNGGAWKQELARELEAAGFDIDWNKAMKA